MTSSTNAQTLAAPSLPVLAKTTAAALVAAAALLVTIVLPAEYAIDPLGTGRWLGLTQIASPPVTVVEHVRSERAPLIPAQHGPIAEYPRTYKTDVAEIVLAPYEYVEYKYQLEKGATMVYSWAADAAVVHDFHGERLSDGSDGAPPEASFDKSGRRQSTGSFTAPFAGIHGWYWENPGSQPITIRLASAGFYLAAVEIRSDRTRHPHTLQSIATQASTDPPDASGAR